MAKESKCNAVPGIEAPLPEAPRKPWISFGIFVAVLGLGFGVPLSKLVTFALRSELNSHVLLIPAIAVYLGWLRKDRIPIHSRPAYGLAALLAVLGGGSLMAAVVLRSRGVTLEPVDALALNILAFVCLVVGGAMVTLGQQRVSALAFPFVFLIFMVPLPTVATHWVEYFFQHQSANASNLLFQVTGTPVLRDGQLFRLPGIVIMVAEECSGIRSSLVLFITCLLAGHLFLRSTWTRSVLALAVIPLGILRNAFRIFTVSMLCVHVDPNMIDSPIHRQGGPVFFLISLVPLFLVLWLCRRWEARRNRAGGNHEATRAVRY